jgi:hypothetical protein
LSPGPEWHWLHGKIPSLNGGGWAWKWPGFSGGGTGFSGVAAGPCSLAKAGTAVNSNDNMTPLRAATTGEITLLLSAPCGAHPLPSRDNLLQVGTAMSLTAIKA